jgi:DNA polymerase III delta prime subunit
MTGNEMLNLKAGLGLPSTAPLSAEVEKRRDVLTRFRNYLQQICESEIVSSDQKAKQIILDMVRCRNMIEINAQVDRLMIRIGELLVAKTGDKTELPRLVSRARERGRAALTRNSKYHAFNEGEAAGPSRVVIKF